MKSWPTAALAALALVATPALAGPASSVPPEQHRISLNTHGSLREAVKHIADDAKLSVVVRGGGEINEAGDFHFENVPAREALDTLAAAYGLVLEQHGSVYTLRPPTGPENAERLMARLRRPGSPPPGPAMAPLPPLPPVPPVPPVPPSVVSKDSDSDEEDMDTDSDSANEDQQEQAEERRAQAEERRAQAEERRTELRERLREMKDKLKLRGLPHHSGNDCDVSVTGNYTVEEGQEACDVVVFGGNLDVLGRVTGDVAVYGGNVHVGSDAEVQGDVVTFGGEVHVDDGAEVHGEQMSFGSSTGNGVMTKGARAWHNVTGKHAETSSHSSLGWSIPRFLLKFAAFFGLSFIFLMFVPARMKQIEAEVKRDPVKCGVAGLVGSVALIPLTIMLAVLVIIGWPFLVVLWLLVLLGIGMGSTAIAAEIGTRLPVLKSTRKTQAAVLAVGIGVLLLVELIPYLGPMVLAGVSLVSLGAVIRTRFGGKPQGYPTPI
jgi:hypothetical protein